MTNYLVVSVNGKFQFHKGTIKTALMHLAEKAPGYFNSIKVRLKQGNHAVYRVIILLFQFHKGTIKTIVR